MKKTKFFTILLTLCVLFISFPVNVFAAEPDEEVTEENYIEYEISPYAISPSSHALGTFNAFFQNGDTVAASNLGSFTISTSSVPAGATITRIVVTSTKSTGSTGTIRVYVGKEVGSDLWIDNALWSSTVTFNDFAGLSVDGTYYFQFDSTRYTSSGIAAATLKNVTVKVYYN